MRIGIMTFWESINNYGQILQLYALQTYLSERGHDPYLIKFHRIPPEKGKRKLVDKILQFNPKKFVEHRVWLYQKKKVLFYDNKREFVAFKNKHIKFGETPYRSFRELVNTPPMADVYICGSDQVWNNMFAVSAEPFMLGFGSDNVKRISYAASFGQKELSNETKELFKKYIINFDGVSVREKSGLEICRSLEYNEPNWLPDPTLLFDKEKWSTLLNLKPKRTTKSRQIFIYTLGNSKIDGKRKFIDYAKGLEDTDVFHASANNDFSGNTYPSIYEWLNIISGSDLIITTSFHGMVFSIIFNRNFIILPNTGVAEGMNERIDSLLGKLNLKDHIMTEFDAVKIDQLWSKKIDWNTVNKDLANWSLETNEFFSQHDL